VRIATGLSTGADPGESAHEAAVAARAGLRGAPCDLVVLFAAGPHLEAPAESLAAVHEALAPAALIGCGAAGVLASAREVEDGPGIAVWAASLGQGSAEAFHAQVEPLDASRGALTGLPDLGGAKGAVLLADPFTFPTDAVLRHLSKTTPLLPLLGGVASARGAGGDAALFIGEEAVDEGAVGVRLDGVEILPCVSHGAAPVGPELTITAAEGDVIVELAGKPALQKLRDTLEELSDEERALVHGGLLMGIVIDPNKPDYVQGDFLVRGLAGADPATGEVAVGTEVRPGQVIRLHARDAVSADRDLREALGARRRALGDRRPAGALVFACNSRGRDMFGAPNHDAEAVDAELAGAPAAGFFAAGEIGPVGGEYFLHGFTATIAVFA